MAAVATSLYVVSTAVFALAAGAVGIRLLLLSLRTGQLAERLLGFGLLLTGCLGYGVMMVAAIGRSTLTDPSAASAVFSQVATAGWIFHNVGVMCMMGFVIHVFRRGVVWARALAIGMSVTLWVGWAIYVYQGGMDHQLPRGGFWISFAVTGTYPFWTATESFLYYIRMRKRVALGLADQLLANRFLLWGLASVGSASAIWVVNLPNLVEGHAAQGQTALSEICMLATGLLGLATVVTFWLTFFAPAWYQRKFTREEA